MKDFKTILREYAKVDTTARKAAVATVVQVRGSSYRSPGARMLITDDGKWVGSISGGCLEGDALRKARQVMLDNKPITVTYDTNEDSNQSLGIGLGCNGIIDVLIEPVDPSVEKNPIALYQSLVNTQQSVALATVFAGTGCIGEKILISNNKVEVRLSDPAMSWLVEEKLASLFETRQSRAETFKHEAQTCDVFLELVQPGFSLIIFGGGFDARPVSNLAKSLGWEVQVTDECAAHIAPLFFPTADKLSLCQRQFIDRDFNITPYTACVLMSHNYEYDRDVLRKLVTTPAPYIGIMGPRKRFDKMLTDFSKEGIALTAEQLDRIHSPIGLDIGAEAPDEIAVAIISEVQARLANRDGGFLKKRDGAIHERDSQSDQVYKQIYF
ncbi:MAG TPA: XdhC/CoxI family protein [Cyclobacteriaceae bacterium]|nr:XdhC/CoxI family protein [Cyclobacteriaceae bacterium]